MIDGSFTRFRVRGNQHQQKKSLDTFQTDWPGQGSHRHKWGKSLSFSFLHHNFANSNGIEVKWKQQKSLPSETGRKIALSSWKCDPKAKSRLEQKQLGDSPEAPRVRSLSLSSRPLFPKLSHPDWLGWQRANFLFCFVATLSVVSKLDFILGRNASAAGKMRLKSSSRPLSQLASRMKNQMSNHVRWKIQIV